MRRSIAVAAMVLALATACSEESDDPGGRNVTATSEPTGTDEPTDGQRSRPPRGGAEGTVRVVDTVATGLQAPWGLDFLPDGRAVVTERDTRRVLLVDPEGGEPQQVAVMEQAAPTGEAGVLGVAVSPDFERDRLVYFYVSTSVDNRIVRATLDRRALWAIQTPQAFRRAALEAALAQDDTVLAAATDDASLVEARGGTVRVVPCSPANLKVTTPHDLRVAELLLRERRSHAGTAP